MFNPYIVKNNNVWTIAARDAQGNIWFIADFNETGIATLDAISPDTKWALDESNALKILPYLEETLDNTEEL